VAGTADQGAWREREGETPTRHRLDTDRDSTIRRRLDRAVLVEPDRDRDRNRNPSGPV